MARKAEEKFKAETEAPAAAVTDDVFVEGEREADSLPELPASLLPVSLWPIRLLPFTIIVGGTL